MQSPTPLTRLPRHDSVPTARLPAPLSALIGREPEVAAVIALLQAPDLRLVTLTGPGGVGKTRLALQVAHALRDHFTGGVWFVPLGSIGDPGLLLSTIAHSLRLHDVAERPIADRIAAFLHERHALVVLDNFEHLIAAAPVVTELLAACPALHVLATSRTRLRLTGEQEFPVSPLTLPDPQAAPLATAIGGAAAVALFVARARAVKPDFALVDDNAASVATICRRLDGLPLAIELATGRITHLSPAALLERLNRPGSSRLPLLSGGPRDAPIRQQTLHATIAWSYDLLNPPEQALFRRLSAFVGGFTLAAAEAVASGQWAVGTNDSALSTGYPLGDSALDLVASLVEKHLLNHTGEVNGDPRFATLEMIREFGLERLAAAGEDEAIRHQHAAYLADLAETVLPRMEITAESKELDRIEVELDNVRAALGWAIARGEGGLALRLAVATFQLWFLRPDLPSEGRRWLEAALATSNGAPSPTRADALFCAASLAGLAGDLTRHGELTEEGLAVSRSADYRLGEAVAIFQLGVAAEWNGRLDEAAVHYEDALRLMHEVGTDYWVALMQTNLAEVTLWRGDVARAATLAPEALARWRNLGSDWGIALGLGTAAAAVREHGDGAQAGQLYEECLALSMTLGDRRGIAGALAGLAGLAADAGRFEQSARLLGAARALGDAIGVRHLAHHLQYERVLAATRARLADPIFTAAWEAGRQLPVDQAIAESLAVAHMAGASIQPRQPHPEGAASVRLTRREHDVLRLLVEGCSDREIADRLYLSVRTASNYVARILAKLGVESRTAAVAFAHRHRLG